MDGELDSVGSNKNNSRKERRLPKKFTCRFCNRLFSTSHARNGHLQIHRQEIKNEDIQKIKALSEQARPGSYYIKNNQLTVAPKNYASIPGGVHTQVQTWGQAGYPSSLSTYSNQNVGGGISGVGPSLPQAGYSSSFSTCSYQNEGGGISGVGSSLPTSYLNQQLQDHTHYQQQQQQEFTQNPGVLLYYQTILGGVQTHVDLSSPSQVQAWPQAGCSSSLSTYSNQNVGGGISGVGASLPTSYLNQQQQDHINYQMRENVGGGISGVGPSLPTSYLNQQQQDHINYQMRERYPSHPNHQMKEIYPSLPYQRNNNLQIGGVSFVNNSGISGPSLPMNSHLQIRGPSFPTFQGGNPNLVVGGYAAASASEQQQQFLSVDPSQQAIHQHWPRLLQPSAPSSATHENDELIPWRREHNS
ncbi:hypothetical protein SUGI_1171020 [Cryptomeria japonica]|nr:hypothetical protein SUGI_1171020 [Cryptomeria japonica]